MTVSVNQTDALLQQRDTARNLAATFESEIAVTKPLIDAVLADWNAAREYINTTTLHGRARAWRLRTASSVALAAAIELYQDQMQEMDQ